MAKDNINREKIVQSVSKMIKDKETVRAYIKGEIPIEKVTEKGIKFAKPL
ncbi:hypothetical protein [Arthrospiribacter ruber]|nr:hypothetical protein [Arthrospiribacter ruber]